MGRICILAGGNASPSKWYRTYDGQLRYRPASKPAGGRRAGKASGRSKQSRSPLPLPSPPPHPLLSTRPAAVCSSRAKAAHSARILQSSSLLDISPQSHPAANRKTQSFKHCPPSSVPPQRSSTTRKTIKIARHAATVADRELRHHTYHPLPCHHPNSPPTHFHCVCRVTTPTAHSPNLPSRARLPSERARERGRVKDVDVERGPRITST